MNIVIFGGSGGLGKQLEFPSHNVTKLSSKDVDITDTTAVEQYFMLHNVDVVINLSGYNSDGMLHKIENWDSVDKTIEVNLKGNLIVTSAAMRYLRDKGGRIILISSILGKKPVMGTSVYSATKAGIDNLVKTAALEGASKGVTVNSIQLGYFDGGLTYTIPEKIREQIKMTIPLKRWGRISELEKTIEWLMDCEYATGMNIPLDGGISFK